MRMKVVTASLVAAGSVLVLSSEGHVRAAGEPVITSTSALGLQADGRYHIQLDGTFDSPADIRVITLCDGEVVPSVVHSASLSTLEISIPSSKTVRCSFIAHRNTDGAESAAGLVVNDSGQNVIGGGLDRGSAARHGFELYGEFPDWSTLAVSVACTQGGDVTLGSGPNTAYNPVVTIDGRSYSQINLSFNDPAPPSYYVGRCTFTPVNAASGRAIGPTFGPLALRPHDAYLGLAKFGVYHWPLGAAVDATAQDALASGQRWINRSGFHTVRVWMSPSMRIPSDNGYNPYHVNLELFERECPVLCAKGAPCDSSPPYLPCAARSSMFQALFSAPDSHYFILTTVDSTSTSDYGNNFKWLVTDGADVSPLNWLDANATRVRAEYRDLALALYETQHDTGKTFIIANWETDSSLFSCKVLNPDRSCKTTYTDNEMFFRVEGYRRWFNLRKQGILDARTIAQARGLGGVAVSDGIEFNVFSAGNALYPNTTFQHHWTKNSIIPYVMPEYMLYSAWDSAGRGKLDQDLHTIKNQFPNDTPQLLIGELAVGSQAGATGTWRGLSDAWATAQSGRAVQRAQLPAAIFWAAYDNTPGEGFVPGFYNANGTERPIVNMIRNELAAGQVELQSAPTARIGGIAVTRSGTWDLFEMYIDQYYGNKQFPPQSALDAAVVRCNYNCSSATCSTSNMTVDVSVPVDSPVRGAYQSNLRIAHRSYPFENGVPIERFCTVKIPGVLTHGPLKMPP